MKLAIVSISVFTFTSAFFLNENDELAKSITRGKLIYNENCVTCHMGNGEGAPPAFPPLAKSDFLIKTPDKAIHAVKFGLTGKIQVNGKEYNSMMPPPGLDNDEIADVMNYIQNSWGNTSDGKMLTKEMVDKIEE
jgi:mono/diheme cytochrome c family protein